jgi:hypothetical protein
MDFPLPLPAFCRGLGKRKREVSAARRVCRGWLDWGFWWIAAARWSVTGEAVTVDGFETRPAADMAARRA